MTLEQYPIICSPSNANCLKCPDCLKHDCENWQKSYRTVEMIEKTLRCYTGRTGLEDFFEPEEREI